MYRLTERFGYQHVEDFLAAYPNGAELTGLLAYLMTDDEVQINKTAHAIVRAFGKPGKGQASDDDEEVIDTTTPEFREAFKGFTNTPAQAREKRHFQQSRTEILMG